MFARDFFGSKFKFGAIDGIYIFSDFNSLAMMEKILSTSLPCVNLNIFENISLDVTRMTYDQKVDSYLHEHLLPNQERKIHWRGSHRRLIGFPFATKHRNHFYVVKKFDISSTSKSLPIYNDLFIAN